MQEFHIKQFGTEIHNPSIYGATTPSGPWPHTEDAPIFSVFCSSSPSWYS